MNTSPAERKVVFATDFSPTAATAQRWAADLAARLRARLHLVHTVPTLISEAELIQEHLVFVETARRRLEEVATELRSSGLDVHTHVAEGHPWRAIDELARAVAADLVVVGSRGLSRLGYVLLGSTAQRVIQLSASPVLCVHEGDRPRAAGRRVLLPTDLSADARLAGETVGRLFGGEAGTTAYLLHVFYVPPEFSHYGAKGLSDLSRRYREQLTAGLGEHLEAAAAELRQSGLVVEVRAREGHPAEVIAKEAEELGVDLVAMGTHGRSGLPRLLLGSTAARVLRRAPCPVLTVQGATTLP